MKDLEIIDKYIKKTTSDGFLLSKAICEYVDKNKCMYELISKGDDIDIQKESDLITGGKLSRGKSVESLALRILDHIANGGLCIIEDPIMQSVDSHSIPETIQIVCENHVYHFLTSKMDINAIKTAIGKIEESWFFLLVFVNGMQQYANTISCDLLIRIASDYRNINSFAVNVFDNEGYLNGSVPL